MSAAVAHGGSGYTYVQGCRCDECRAANARRNLRRRHERAAEIAADPSLAPHGSPSTYTNWGCRCDPCSAANSAKCKAYQAERRNTT